ncbi:OB-fold domain-containing protein [Sphingomonas sp. G-3-2-10]|uniref:Zn-ribbon domain-containing OB-fold protein n=1 Tax=Sphingomonas sp. G-3-2-10 TaxID=2728838 RepID=UPI00146F7051|nr:OB-fold domain-containing protein [Sphingomonas sp. G-3-2-10]NML08430.1 hypothetical protein [Sphingomonas sp. G-3-2-10]
MTAKPQPQPTPLTEPYWAAASQGKLSLQRCTACAVWHHFPVPRCTSCGSDALTFEPVSGHGTVETFTIVHRSFAPGFTGAPYAMAWIALPEQAGLRVFANVTDCLPETVTIGMKVTVWFEQRGDFALPNFRPA